MPAKFHHLKLSLTPQPIVIHLRLELSSCLLPETREKAYIYSISSAGVMHSVTKACAKGQLNICSCDIGVRQRDTKGEFMWGGCSHNVNFGDKFTGEFVDSNENPLIEEGLMNLWNNNAGRRVSNNDKGNIYRTSIFIKCENMRRLWK